MASLGYCKGKKGRRFKSVGCVISNNKYSFIKNKKDSKMENRQENKKELTVSITIDFLHIVMAITIIALLIFR